MKKFIFLGLAAVFAVSLVNCGKKKGPGARAAVNTGKPPVSNPVAAPTGTSVPASNESAKTDIEGNWWTDCGSENAIVFARNYRFVGNLVAMIQYSYENMESCQNDIDRMVGGKEYYAIFKITKIDDGVMTHKVEYVLPTGSVTTSFVLSLSENKQDIIMAPESFLTSREASSYNEFLKKY